MRKLVYAFIGVFLSAGAMAADVAERTSCADIKSRMDTLAASGELGTDDAALLSDLRATYRRDCAMRAGARASRTIAATRAPSAPVSATPAAAVAEQPVIAEPCDNPDSNGCCPGEEFADMGDAGKFCCKDDMCFPPMDVTPAAPEKTAEEIAAEIAANIEKGLCGDGTKPNKFGCCAGEKFTDLGNLVFACCPEDGRDCYPPMK